MAAAATQRLTPATPRSIWIAYAVPSLLTSFPKGMNPATQVTADRNSSGKVIVSGASCGLCAA